MDAPKVELLRGLRQEVSMEGLPDCSMPWPRPPPAISPQLGLMNQETTVTTVSVRSKWCTVIRCLVAWSQQFAGWKFWSLIPEVQWERVKKPRFWHSRIHDDYYSGLWRGQRGERKAERVWRVSFWACTSFILRYSNHEKLRLGWLETIGWTPPIFYHLLLW